MLTDPESTAEQIVVDDLAEAIGRFTNERGYRLDMIFPADNPREAVLSEPPAAAGGLSSDTTIANQRRTIRLKVVNTHEQPPTAAAVSEWVTGRAGMQYRDLVPDRLGGRLIASHIRLTAGGPVPDYVHYHKVEFQMIYCYRGRVRVVYEDQGPPFWLEPGDCVLQPPEIRHRVLEAEAGTEVIEIGVPAVHETWVEHQIDLPTAQLRPGRVFGGQRFVRHISADAAWQNAGVAGFESRDTGISDATLEFADVRAVKPSDNPGQSFKVRNRREMTLIVSLDDGLSIGSNGAQFRLDPVGAFTLDKNAECTVYAEKGPFLLIEIGSD